MSAAQDVPKASILIVEDDPDQVWIYSQALVEYRLSFAPTASAALTELSKFIPDVILLDHVLAGGELGGEWLPKLKDAAAHVPVIMVSGLLEAREQLQLLQGPRAATFVVTKPVNLTQLRKTVEIALTECGVAEAVRMLQSIERTEKLDGHEPDRRFVERLARQHAMLKRLRAEGVQANVSQLSRVFRVSRRTIARDLQELVQRGQLPPALYPEWDKDSASADCAE